MLGLGYSATGNFALLSDSLQALRPTDGEEKKEDGEEEDKLTF